MQVGDGPFGEAAAHAEAQGLQLMQRPEVFHAGPGDAIASYEGEAGEACQRRKGRHAFVGYLCAHLEAQGMQPRQHQQPVHVLVPEGAALSNSQRRQRSEPVRGNKSLCRAVVAL